MSAITWKEVYETNIVVLDKEHRRLVEQINRLYQAIREKRSEEIMLSIFDELVSYTDQHFANEERLLTEYGYPQLAEQQAEHKRLAQQVHDYRQQLDGDSALSATEVMGFLRQWLLDHIVKHDMQYGPYLESRGGRFLE
ncbi:MAG TPA: bacteriohemerythrin [Malonomonas sp.]